MSMQDYEKMGAFYLGRAHANEGESGTGKTLLFDSRDLTTHAVCVGMTGSGKTGLCVTLLEEAAIDHVPAICIDPKGDLGNLLLNFPSLRPEDFSPWVDEAAATREGLSVTDYAARTAETWRRGLADWDQSPDRIRRLRESVDMTIYTPGSEAGMALNILRSLAAPDMGLRQDRDALRDRVLASVSGLLALLGIDADPLQSREHILLSNLLDRAWQAGRDLDLPRLIQEIHTPPFARLGVFDLESFYPAKDRLALAMRLNNILASPGFAAWMQGEPLDVQRLLYTADGRPKLSILSIAHLSDAERMFCVTLLLNEVVAWMRGQPGTASLRAILYMDEVFGYLPPTANPPSKTPMLTLLKQGRAFGLGCVLATQNPVDLDYKALSNAGAWFIGRLQTDRDRDRVMDGLEGASRASGMAFDRTRIEATLAGLGKRVFLMNNVHDETPTLFQTRWALSYLRGPLTRTQIAKLMAEKKEGAAAPPQNGPTAPQARPESQPIPKTPGAKPPALPPSLKQRYLVAPRPPAEGTRLVYRPELQATARLHFVDARTRVDLWQERTCLAPFPTRGTSVDWEASSATEGAPPEWQAKPEAGAGFSEPPPSALAEKNYRLWHKTFASYLYRAHTLRLFTCPSPKAYSAPDETEGAFRARLSQLAREARDLRAAKLRARYAPKLEALETRIRRAEQKVEVEQSQYQQKAMQTVLSFGATLLGSFLGRRKLGTTTISRASTAVRTAGRASKEKQDIGRAEDNLATLQEKLRSLTERFQEEIAAWQRPVAPSELVVEVRAVRPRKTDIAVETVCLAWTPWQVDSAGVAERLSSCNGPESLRPPTRAGCQIA